MQGRASVWVPVCGGLLLAALAPQRAAAAPATADRPPYAVDAITAMPAERDPHHPLPLCTVWADAEGLGVGPADLAGFHGLSLTLDLSSPAPAALDQALAAAKAAYPNAPTWLIAAVRAHAAQIGQACSAPRSSPVVIAKLTPRDRKS